VELAVTVALDVPLSVTVAPLPPLPLIVPEMLNVLPLGLTVKVAVCVPLKVAEIVTDVELVTAVVVTVKVAVVAPAATVTLAGTVAAALLLDKLTDPPPVGAMPLKVTVPVDEVPPLTEAGFRVTDEITGGFIARVAV